MEATRLLTYLMINVMNAYILNFLFSNMLGKKKGMERIFYPAFLLVYGTVFFVNLLKLPLLNIVVSACAHLAIIFPLYEGKFGKKMVLTIFWYCAAFFAEMIAITILGLDFNGDKMRFILHQDFFYLISASVSQLTYLVIVKVCTKLLLRENLLIGYRQLLAYLAMPIATIILLTAVFAITMENFPSIDHLNLVIFSCLAIVMANLVIFSNFYRFSSAQHEIKQLALSKQQLNIEQRYYKILDSKYKKNRQVIHDINNHLACISGLVHTGNKEHILQYVNQIHHEIKDLSYCEITGSRVLDIILNQKLLIAKDHDIDFAVESPGCQIGEINDVHLCTIVGNVLDNALEATMNDHESWINLQLYNDQEYLILELRNSCKKAPRVVNGILVTNKKDGVNHGIGMGNVKRVVNIYDGRLEYQYKKESNEFRTYIAIRTDKKITRFSE